MSVIKTRGHQLFRVLDAVQIDTAKRFASGPLREFAPAEIVFDVSERDVPVWLVLKGSIDVVRRYGLNHEAAITSLGPGQFSGEVSQLAGATTLAPGNTRREPQCESIPGTELTFQPARRMSAFRGKAYIPHALSKVC